jgi:hypothetical protein
MESLYTQLSHHGMVSVFVISQNLFTSSPIFRSIFRNTHILFLKQNLRDRRSISTLSSQMNPGNSRLLVQILNHVTKKDPYAYLVVDFRLDSKEWIRFRNNIFNDEWPGPGTCICYI